MSDWTAARIRPQDVDVRRVDNPAGEPLVTPRGERLVKQGHYIIRTRAGFCWSCSPEVYEQCYEARADGGGVVWPDRSKAR